MINKNRNEQWKGETFDGHPTLPTIEDRRRALDSYLNESFQEKLSKIVGDEIANGGDRDFIVECLRDLAFRVELNT